MDVGVLKQGPDERQQSLSEKSKNQHVSKDAGVHSQEGRQQHESERPNDRCVLAVEVFMRWCSIGRSQGLTTFSDIASFLIEQYEATRAGSVCRSQCDRCCSPLTLFCLTCQRPAHQPLSSEGQATGAASSRMQEEVEVKPETPATLPAETRSGTKVQERAREAKSPQTQRQQSQHTNGRTPAPVTFPAQPVRYNYLFDAASDDTTQPPSPVTADANVVCKFETSSTAGSNGCESSLGCKGKPAPSTKAVSVLLKDMVKNCLKMESSCSATAEEGNIKGEAASGKRPRKRRKDAGVKQGKYWRRDASDTRCTGEGRPGVKDAKGSGMIGRGAKSLHKKEVKSSNDLGEVSPVLEVEASENKDVGGAVTRGRPGEHTREEQDGSREVYTEEAPALDQLLSNDRSVKETVRGVKRRGRSETRINHQGTKQHRKNHQEPRETRENHQQPKETRKTRQKPKETRKNHQKAKEPRENHQERKETRENHQEPKETRENHQEPKETMKNHQEPKETIESRQEPKETGENQEPIENQSLAGDQMKIESQTVVCDTCGKEMRSKKALYTHRSQYHGEKRHRCELCGDTFLKRWLLQLHRYKHTGERPFSCEICSATFTRNYCLQQHVLNLHHNRRSYVCDKCGRSFNQLGSLRTHIRLHSGERPYQCKYCHVTFVQAGGLSSHMRSHTGVKPYLCKECGAVFSHVSNLHVHLRIHSGERPYVCKECGFGAITSSQLKKHMWRHTGQKPKQVTCSVCDRVLSCGKLNRHMKNVHGLETPPRRVKLPTSTVPVVPESEDRLRETVS